MKNERDSMILDKIERYCEEIERTHRFFHDDKELFMNKDDGFVYRNLITMPILQIGELAKQLSVECRKELSSIPWKEISGMRDVFAHHYGSIDHDIVWQTSREDISELRKKLAQR